MGFQTGNEPNPKENWHQVSSSPYPQAASQVGLFTKGSAEKVCKAASKEEKKDFKKEYKTS